MSRWAVIGAAVLTGCLGCFGSAALACGAESTSFPSLASRLASSGPLLDVAQQNGVLIAVGGRGHILRSRDSGVTWKQTATPVRVLLTALWAGPAEQVWVVGHDSTILHSADGGLSWRCQHSDTGAVSPLFDIRFSDERNGLAVGAYGLVLRTVDGGRHWRQQQITPDDNHFYALVESESGLWLVGESGVIWRSADEGLTWMRFDSGEPGSLFAGVGLPGGDVLLTGQGGRLLRCSPRGGCERTDLVTTRALFAAARTETGVIHLAGEGGAHWRGDPERGFLKAPSLDPRGVSALLPLPNGSLLSVGGNGVWGRAQP